MYFIPWGGFLNDLGPNLVSDLPVIPLVWQERGHARASCAVRLSSPICRVARPHRALLHDRNLLLNEILGGQGWVKKQKN